MRISDCSSDVCSSDLLGYKTEITGKHGAVELLGPNGEKINKEALDGFSKRGNDIKAKAEELGVHSPEGRRAITQRTRDPKMDAGDRAELAERWRAEARDYRYNGDQIYAMALARSRERSSPIERGILAVSTAIRSEEHTSELQSLMRISYAVFCFKKKKRITKILKQTTTKTLQKTNTSMEI